MKILNIPIEEETLQLLDEVAGYYALSRPRLVQKLLREGMRTARLDYAAELYARREVTLERAAELARVSIYEMMVHLRERDIPAQRRASDIRDDAAAMLMRSGRSDGRDGGDPQRREVPVEGLVTCFGDTGRRASRPNRNNGRPNKRTNGRSRRTNGPNGCGRWAWSRTRRSNAEVQGVPKCQAGYSGVLREQRWGKS